ncbi:MAG: hypothetical protein ACOC8E_03435 [Planctomycetota bacterium]
MRRSIPMSVLLVAMALVGGCSRSKYEQMQEEQLELLRQLNDTLEGVTAKDSLRQALPAIREARRKLLEKIAEREELGEPAPEVASELKEDFKDALAEENARYGRQMRRIAELVKDDEGLRKELSEAMKGLPPEF